MFPSWNDLVYSRRFWLGYLAAGVDLSKCPSLRADHQWDGLPGCGLRLSFHLPAEFILRLQISDGEHYLEYFEPGFKGPKILANMDCHQMSDLFRWNEYQAVVKFTETHAGPTWAHEMIFGSYVAVTDDCLERFIDVVRRSFGESKLFSDSEIEYIVNYKKRVALRKDFRWTEVPDVGWVADGRDSYSLRKMGKDFDHGAFQRMMTAVKA